MSKKIVIDRFFMENHLSFREVELYFQNGLIVFTGASGAGKSLLLNSILGTLGQKETKAKLSEVTFIGGIDLGDFGIESDEDITIFRQIRKEKLRYFINNQAVSKKIVQKIGKLFIDHLNPREIKEFQSDYLIDVLDSLILHFDSEYRSILDSYSKLFAQYTDISREIAKLSSSIEELEEKEEFLKFEIERIDKIDPKSGEYEELQQTKKRLSKKDKIETYIDEVAPIFEKRLALIEIFDLMGYEDEAQKVGEFIDTLESQIEDIRDKLSELDEIDISRLLDRIEILAELNRKYGDIQKALEYRDSKVEELKYLQTLREKKGNLEKNRSELVQQLEKVAMEMREKRKGSLEKFTNHLDSYLKYLKIGKSQLILEHKDFSHNGIDSLRLEIENRDIDTFSYGEQNRVRLAILAISSKFTNIGSGVLFLDEVDANLSGDESLQVAKMVKELSKNYQIFAISHQPQLTAVANQHFLITKENGESKVIELDSKDKRIDEIIRIIGGDKKDRGVRKFAMELMKRG